MYKRESVLGTLGKIGASLVLAAPVGAVIVGVGNTLVTLVRLPEAIGRTYRAILTTPRVGPVIKTTVSLVLPVAVVALPPTILFASTIVGVCYGFWQGCDYYGKGKYPGILNGFVKSAELVKDFNHELVTGGFQTLEEARLEPLEDGKQAYDIPIVDGLRGVVSAVLVAPFEAIGLTCVVLRHWPRTVYRAYRELWRNMDDSITGFAITVAMSVLLVPIALLTIPLTPVASIAVGVVDTCIQGYRHGVRRAFTEMSERVKNTHKTIKDFLDGKAENARRRAAES